MKAGETQHRPGAAGGGGGWLEQRMRVGTRWEVQLGGCTQVRGRCKLGEGDRGKWTTREA